MPLGRRIARFNRVVTNRLIGLVAPRLPGFGVVVHTGRSSGRTYRTPVNVFRRDDWFVIALTYGADTDWVRNVLAADGCVLVTRGRSVSLGVPRVVHDEGRGGVPPFVRRVLGWLGVEDFLTLYRAPSEASVEGL